MKLLQLSYLSARLCHASYPGEEYRFNNMLKAHTHIHGEEHGADCFIGETDEYNFVIFRGTEVSDRSFSWRDIATDLKISMTKVKGNDYQLHRGFFTAWQEIAARVSEITMSVHCQAEWYEEKAKPWVFTGHSLGAAMACIAAATLKPAKCITFGGPTVGGPLFAEALDDACAHYRWVNKGDWCPRVPPSWLGYEHGGTLMFIDEDDELHISPEPAFVRQQFLSDLCSARYRHGIERYVDNIGNQLMDSFWPVPKIVWTESGAV